MEDKDKILSPEDCRAIVDKHFPSHDFEVLYHEEEQLFTYSGPGEASAEYLSVKILLNNSSNELRFLAKHFTTSQSSDGFYKEMFAYDFLFQGCKDEYPDFDLDFAPTFYFAKDDKLIVFEDLFHQRFVLPKNFNNLDLEHIKLALETLAKYHSASIAFEEATMNSLTEQKNDILESSWFKARLEALNSLIDLVPENNLPHQDFKEKLCKVADDCLEIIKPNSNFRNVLCHGSTWDDNVLFKYKNGSPVKCKLLNFELQHYNPPALDVLHFIYRTTTTDTRKHHLHKLLQFYYDCLKIELGKINLDVNQLLPWKEDFEASVHHLLPLVKLNTACFRQIQCLSPAFRERINADTADGTNISTEAFKTSEDYRKLMTESIWGLYDLVTHNELTLEDCFKIVEKKTGTTNYKLLNYEIAPLGKVSGYLGDHNKLKIDICINKERTTLNFFAKFVPKAKGALQVVLDAGACYKEIFFYERFIPMLRSFGINIINECVVSCYFTRHNHVVILDDYEFLSYKTLDPREPYPYNIVCMIIKKMAKFHACSIILEEKMGEKTNTKYCLKDHYPKQLHESFFVRTKNHQGAQNMQSGIDAVELLLSLYPDENSPISEEDVKVKVNRAFQELYELVKQSGEFRNVICHGDLWVTNVLIQCEDGEPTDKDCRIIDFQLYRYCPPAHDVLIFLYLTTNRSFRQQYFAEVLDLYHSELAQNLSHYGYDIQEICSYDSFMKIIEYMTPQAVCQTVIYFELALINQDIVKEYMVDEEACANILVGDRRDFITSMYNRDPLFRERVGESIQDLRAMSIKYF